MSNTLHEAFASHILRYVGVGLISGSVVHAGTLGGSTVQYAVLIVLGVVIFAVGTYLEERKKTQKALSLFVLVSVALSVGTGMVSGGFQHFLDGPTFAAMLIPVGFCIAYVAFVFRDYTPLFSWKLVSAALVASMLGWFILHSVTPFIPQNVSHEDGEMSGSH